MARRGTVERVLIGCGGLAILAVLAVVLLGLGAILGNSDVDVDIEEPIEDILDEQDGGGESAQVQPGAQPDGIAPATAAALVVRVTGPPGTAYSGTYGTAQGGMTPVEGVLGAGPAEYAVEAAGGAFGEVRAVFQKSQPVPGMLRAEVLSAGEVVAEGSTSEESDWVEVNWSP
ncbi:MAG: hypothetical protein M3491_12185 [Actinomycetota bacterium]|nr:hypothetical protein [Actinomycetota bacterium]